MANIVTYNDWFNVAPCVVDKTINPNGESIIDKTISPIPDTNDVDETYLQVAMKVSQQKSLPPVIDRKTGVQDCRDVMDGVHVYKAQEDAYPTNMTAVDNEEELYRDNIGEALEETPVEPVIEKVIVEKVEETEEKLTIDASVVVEPEISEITVSTESIVDIVEESPIVENIVEEKTEVVEEKLVVKKKTTEKKQPAKRATKKKIEADKEPKENVSKPRKSTRKTTKVKENK